LEAAAETRRKLTPDGQAGITMAKLVLTAEQEAEARRMAALVAKKVEQETLEMCRLMVSKADRDLHGKTEFEIRDRVHALGAHVIETALNERKKGGTKGRA
jgi:hypothetical protein